MRRCLALVAATLLSAKAVSAQAPAFEVKGRLVDSSGPPLPGVSVVAHAIPDFVLASFTVTRGDGTFTLRRLRPADYTLLIRHVGFRAVYLDVAVSNADMDAGRIPMGRQTAALDEIVVSADHIPILITRDTLLYNLRAFPLRPNDSADDLLSRLPGIDVLSDGSIVTQGEMVRNVLVDDTEYFRGNPAVVTQALPARIVESVEVFDKESDEAELTGIPDGNEEKTVNPSLTTPSE